MCVTFLPFDAYNIFYLIYIMPASILCSIPKKIEILTWPIQVISESQRYLKNQGDMLLMTMMSAHVHTCQRAYTLLSGALRPISQPNWVGSEILMYIWNQENMLDLSEHNLTQACTLACMHAMCLRVQTHISAKFGHIREIKVSTESGDHAGPL